MDERDMLEEARKLSVSLFESIPATNKKERFLHLRYVYGMSLPYSKSYQRILGEDIPKYGFDLLVRISLTDMRKRLPDEDYHSLKRAFEQGRTPSYDEWNKMDWHWRDTLLRVNRRDYSVKWTDYGKFFFKYCEFITPPPKREVAQRLRNYRRKQSIKSTSYIVAIALFAILMIIMVFLGKSGAIREAPSSTPDVIVFQTGLNFGSIAGLVFVIIGVASSILIIRWANKDRGVLWLMVFPVILVGMGGLWVYSHPLQEEIVVDKPAQAITAEKDYLAWNRTLHVTFDEIQAIKYEGRERRSRWSATGFFSELYGIVKIVKPDGTEIEVHSDGRKSVHNLAEAIAKGTGKRLVQ